LCQLVGGFRTQGLQILANIGDNAGIGGTQVIGEAGLDSPIWLNLDSHAVSMMRVGVALRFSQRLVQYLNKKGRESLFVLQSNFLAAPSWPATSRRYSCLSLA